MFQENKSKIKDEFEKISSSLITNIGKNLYNLEDFMVEQEKHLGHKEDDFQ